MSQVQVKLAALVAAVSNLDHLSTTNLCCVMEFAIVYPVCVVLSVCIYVFHCVFSGQLRLVLYTAVPEFSKDVQRCSKANNRVHVYNTIPFHLENTLRVHTYIR